MPVNHERIASFTPEQIEAALDCVENLLGDYARGALRGGEMSWDDLDATFDAARVYFRDVYEQKLREHAREYHPTEDWTYDVANGDTTLGYEDWLAHQVESCL